MDHHPPTHRILSDADVDAVARRVVEMIGKHLSEPKAPETPPAPPPAPLKPLTPKLAYTLQELSEELGISRVSFYRLEARGILKPLPYLRHKIYSHGEVARFLSGIGGEIRPDERPRRGEVRGRQCNAFC